MKVLSLFDGISAGRVALDRAGIKVDEYHAYEIDKYAIMVSEKNYPDIIHHGDVLDEDFTKYKGFDLLIMGPPCQDFSRAGGEAGFDGERGKLMLKAIEVLKTVKPKWWLIENTPMKKETVDTISELVGCKPVKIDAARVSAQRRERLYWTNIPIGLIEDRHILLEDIVEEDALVDKDKSHAIIASIGRTTHRGTSRRIKDRLCGKQSNCRTSMVDGAKQSQGFTWKNPQQSEPQPVVDTYLHLLSITGRWIWKISRSAFARLHRLNVSVYRRSQTDIQM